VCAAKPRSGRAGNALGLVPDCGGFRCDLAHTIKNLESRGNPQTATRTGRPGRNDGANFHRPGKPMVRSEGVSELDRT